VSFPETDEIHGVKCYKLLTDRDREIDKWLAVDFPKEV